MVPQNNQSVDPSVVDSSVQRPWQQQSWEIRTSHSRRFGLVFVLRVGNCVGNKGAVRYRADIAKGTGTLIESKWPRFETLVRWKLYM